MGQTTKSRLITIWLILIILIHILFVYLKVSGFFSKEEKNTLISNDVLEETECYFNKETNPTFFINLLKEKNYKQLETSLIQTKCLPSADSWFFEELTLEKQVPQINNIWDILEYWRVLNLMNMLYITYDVDKKYIDETIILSWLGIEYSGTMVYLTQKFMKTLDKNSIEYKVKMKSVDTMILSQYQVLNGALMILKKEDIYTEDQLIKLATIFKKNFRILFDDLSKEDQLDIISSIWKITLTTNIPEVLELLIF